jgi:hypothetical protein
MDEATSKPAPGPLALWRRLVGKHLFRRGGVLVVLALVLEYLVLPQIAGVRRSLNLLGRVNMAYVALGVLLEVASLASYAQLTKAVLPERACRFSRVWRIDLSTLAVSHVLPGGTAGGDGLGYRLLTNEGVSGSDAGLALAVQGIGSALVLNVILWLALIVSIPVSGFNPIYGTAAVVGALLLAAFGGLVWLLTRGEERAAVIIRREQPRRPTASCTRSPSGLLSWPQTTPYYAGQCCGRPPTGCSTPGRYLSSCSLSAISRTPTASS